MTKDELKKEAEEYATKRASKLYTRNMWDRYYQTYIDSAEPREKRIAELEAQIEKMKCCGNCKNLKGRFDRNTNVNILYCSDSDMKQIEVGFQMCCCKWEKKND